MKETLENHVKTACKIPNRTFERTSERNTQSFEITTRKCFEEFLQKDLKSRMQESLKESLEEFMKNSLEKLYMNSWKIIWINLLKNSCKHPRRGTRIIPFY